MFRFKEYVLAESLEQAYQLNQKKRNVILGGMLWLKMEDVNKQTAIDLSGLGLDKIEEDEQQFSIGCMATLRDLELNTSLNQYFQGAFKECVKHIIGTQFRNTATVGGSVFGRFGFSDVLTLLMSMDAYVELYQGGIVSMAEFAAQKKDNDILVRVIVKKDARKVTYLCERKAATDFPLITCSVFQLNDSFGVALGARPGRAQLFNDEKEILKNPLDESQVQSFCEDVISRAVFGTNMRAAADYRNHLATVLLKRGIQDIVNRKEDSMDEN